jgi:hypothetical protein
MIDPEVMRLRRLRNVALRARALARSFVQHGSEDSLFAKGALLPWQVSRIATGHLRSHPFLSYQQEPGWLRRAYDCGVALILASLACRRNRRMSTYLEQLRQLSRELDDTRALTRAPDLSDELGRSQVHLRRLVREVDDGAQREIGVRPGRIVTPSRGALTAPREAGSTDWPYLAI